MINYEKTIERILELFRDTSGDLQLLEIAKYLKIRSDSEEYEILKDILRQLCSQKLLVKLSRRRYKLNEYEAITRLNGTLKVIHERGIVTTDNPKIPEIVIKRRDLSTALDGDSVSVRLLPAIKGKKVRGEIIEVLQRHEHMIVGTVDFDGEFFYLIPDEDCYYTDFLIPRNFLKGAKHKDKVAATFHDWKDPLKNPKAAVVDIIGKSGEPRTEFDSLIKELGLPGEFPITVKNESQAIDGKIPRNEISRRLDLRKKTIVTIDPEDAKDFDDALSLESLDNGNVIVGVHIADVSHYVKENSDIDIEARRRATSIYLPDRVIPMLPEKLSNELCSLKPGVDRLSFSVLMEFSPRGTLKNYEIKETVIKSKRRYSYNEVKDILSEGRGENYDLLSGLNKMAKILRKKRFQSGGIDFETFEIKFELDENRQPEKANLKLPNDATSLVEEFMLAANKVVASHSKKLAKAQGVRNLPYLFRVHDAPDEKHLKESLSFIYSFLSLKKIKNPGSKDINMLLHSIKDMNHKFIVNNILIRSMSKAIYSPSNIGHYGLGFDEYTHFTSPIRRYPDLIIHRIIKEFEAGKSGKERIQFLAMLLKDVAQLSTERERLSVESEREAIKLTSSILCKKRIGETFTGTVSGVTSFGVFVFLDEVFAEGLIHVKDLNDDYYIFDEKNFCLIGRNKRKVFRMGKKVVAQIISSSVERRKIDLKYLHDLEK
jgi:ribonuclease R